MSTSFINSPNVTQQDNTTKKLTFDASGIGNKNTVDTNTNPDVNTVRFENISKIATNSELKTIEGMVFEKNGNNLVIRYGSRSFR